MFGLGPIEIGIIILAIGILFFGHKRITGLARSIGRFGGEYKKSKREIEEELKRGEAQAEESASAPAGAETSAETRAFGNERSKAPRNTKSK